MYLKKKLFQQNILLFILSVSALSFLMLSCNSTDSGSEGVEFQDGISSDIRELVGEDLLNVIENELEMTIHRGDNPPDVEAMLSPTMKNPSISETGTTILLAPNLLLKTNVPNDEGRFEGGERFKDSYYRFSNQNMDNYTIAFDQTHIGNAPNLGPDSFIIGDGNNFSVFGKQVREDEGTVISVRIFSGNVSQEGISAARSALIIIDDGGVSNVIPEGTGRSFEDGDGTARIAEWPGDQEQSSGTFTGKDKDRLRADAKNIGNDESEQR